MGRGISRMHTHHTQMSVGRDIAAERGASEYSILGLCVWMGADAHICGRSKLHTILFS